MTQRISELARATGTSPSAIRYYEKIGLLPAPHRRATGHRRYEAGDAAKVRFIRRCRELGLTLAQVRALMQLNESGERSCREVRHMGEVHLASLRHRIGELQTLEARLAALLEGPGKACGDSRAADCPALRALSAASLWIGEP